MSTGGYLIQELHLDRACFQSYFCTDTARNIAKAEMC